MSDNIYSAEIIYRMSVIKYGVEPQRVRTIVDRLLYSLVGIGKAPVCVFMYIWIFCRCYNVSTAVSQAVCHIGTAVTVSAGLHRLFDAVYYRRFFCLIYKSYFHAFILS